MRRSARNALLLTGCLLLIGAAGVFAFIALNGASAEGAQPLTASLRVVQNDPGGLAKLTTVASTKLASGTTLPAGTAVSIPSVTLASALTPAQAPAIGATLRCDLSVNWTKTAQVIDIIQCSPAAASTP
ncbi:MAG TPA: hypothetical protein VHZ97_28930 [Pseudonocardiaceae bacterium]|jgi:hypothetical protein|nr:hypothetical protein [Pseudonocardiaceae bacterium]